MKLKASMIPHMKYVSGVNFTRRSRRNLAYLFFCVSSHAVLSAGRETLIYRCWLHWQKGYALNHPGPDPTHSASYSQRIGWLYTTSTSSALVCATNSKCLVPNNLSQISGCKATVVPIHGCNAMVVLWKGICSMERDWEACYAKDTVALFG